MRSRSFSWPQFLSTFALAMLLAIPVTAQSQMQKVVVLRDLKFDEANKLVSKAQTTAIFLADLPKPAKDALLQKISALPGSSQPPVPESAQDGKIIGGNTALYATFQWQVGLIFRAFNDENRVIFCGGSLMSPTVVLTAAHCFKDVGGAMGANEVDVLVGVNNYADTTQGERIQVRSIDLHPQFNMTTYENDLAILRLARPATHGKPIAPYGSHQEKHPLPVGTALYVSGWGTTSNLGTAPQELQWAMVPTADLGTCNAAQAYAGLVKADMICAGFPDGKVDACKGDSGGPAVYTGTNAAQIAPLLYGVVSWGAKGQCAAANKLGVYSAVQPHLAWISEFLTP